MCAIHSLNLPRWSRLLLAPALALGLAACGGGGGSSPSPGPSPTPTASYTVGGTLSGLGSGAQVQLLDNGGDALTLSANGSFQFATSLQQGSAYAVTVGTQPTGETCSVANATGSAISANVTNVTVTCSPSSSAYTIGGTVTGLASGQQVTLVDNGTDSLVVSANGNFQFTGQIAQGGSYQVTIGSQPSAQTCVLGNASGSNVGANVSTVTLSCRTSYAFVTNSGSSNVSMYSLGAGGALTALTGSPLPTAGGPAGVAVTPNGLFAYIATQSMGTVTQYTLNGSQGLTPGPTAYATGSSPTGVIVDPTGHFVYVMNQSTSGSVSAYSINQSSGALTAVAKSPFGAGNGTILAATDPLGKYLYVTNNGGGNISQYSIDSTTGALTALNPSTVLAGTNPRGIVVTPSGAYAYVANFSSNTISSYTVNATTGVLTSLSASAATPLSPWGLAITPDGKHLYAVSYQSNGVVLAYSINSDGSLTLIGSGGVATGPNPTYLSVDPTGRYLYVTNTAATGTPSVSQFSIGSNGALTAMSTATVSAGTGPQGIAVY